MAGVKIVPLDPTDRAAFDAWYDCYLASDTHERPWQTAWTRHESEIMLTRPNDSVRKVPIAALDQGIVVGGALVEFTLLDNTSRAEFELFVHPDHRDGTVGDAIMDEAERLVRAEGRTQILAWWPYDLGTAPADGALVGLALRRGYREAMVEYQRALDLPVEVPEYSVADGYRLVTFEGFVPEAYREGVRGLEASFDTEAPSGVEWEPAVITAAIEDARWAREVAMGRTRVTTIALSDADEVVAYTWFGVPREFDWCFQDATLVVPAHRGHGLGMAIKWANLAALQRLFPAKRSVRTWNAGDNAWMVAINDAMGYRAVEAMAELVKDLD